MAGTDWAKFGLTAELTVVVPKKTADTKLGVTLSSYENDVGHPRIRGEARPFLPAWPHVQLLTVRRALVRRAQVGRRGRGRERAEEE